MVQDYPHHQSNSDLFLQELHIPRHLLDNLPNELSALAQMTLGSADSWLDNSGLGFLKNKKCVSPLSPSSKKILQEVRRAGDSYMTLVQTDDQAAAFL